MNLPKLAVPSFTVMLPTTKKKYKVRPYLVQEQKIMLIGLESDNKEDLINAINEVIDRCVDGIDAKTLPYFDFIYLYLKLYIMSNGETVSLRLPHISNTECQAISYKDICLDDVTIVNTDGHTNKIDLNSDIGVIMRYPTALELTESIIEIKTNLASSNQNLIMNCIDSIYDNETIYKVQDYTREEYEEWFASLGKKELEKIQDFFFTMPRPVIDVEFTCLECGKTERFEIRDFSDFFFSP